MSERIMLFGGSFNPPHMGHLLMAETASETMQCPVRFVPAARPPHKDAVIDASHRVAMVELAIAGNSRFILDTTEVDRPGVSYTYETLSAIADEGQPKPYFLLGADSLADMDTWHNPRGVLELCVPVIYRRRPFPEDLVHRLQSKYGLGSVEWVEGPMLEVSSSMVRERMAKGLSIRYMVPGAVEEYIYRYKLYQEGN